MLTNPTVTEPAAKFRLASPLMRLLAWAIDKVVLFPLLLVYAAAMGISKNIFLAVFALFLDLSYKVILEKRRGATIGKRLLRLRVVDRPTGEAISWNQSLLRALPWALSFYAYVFYSIRLFETPGFMEATDPNALRAIIEQHPLTNSTIIGLLQFAPFLSSTWIVSDSLLRAIHDRLGRTVVIRARAAKEEE